jgi:integrase
MVGPCLGCAAMSGTHAPHLQRRSGIFYLRVRVPDDLKLRVGMLEVRRSLQTYAPTKARLLAAIYAPRVMEVFRMLRANDFTRDDARAFVLTCFQDLRRQVDDGYIPSSNRPDLEMLEQQEMAKEQICVLQECAHDRTFSGLIVATAHEAAEARGVDLTQLPRTRQVDVYEGVARALVEQQRIFLTRLGDRLAPHSVSDPLFAAEDHCTGGALRRETELGAKLSSVIAAYLQAGRSKWTEKTLAGRVRQLRFVEEHFGAETSIGAITSHDVRRYRDAVRRLRSNHHAGKGLTFSEKQTSSEAHRIDPKTASLIFETAKAFFRWANATEGYIPSNPAADVRIEAPKKPKGKKPRRPFSSEELEILFSSPLFTGSKSMRRRFEPGPVVFKDDCYSIPIIGFYTGARLGEIVQLHLEDVQFDGPIPHFEITEENSGATGSQDAKHVKSAAGVRKVPLHPDLLTLGFAEFVAQRRKGKSSSKRLFHRIAYGADKRASTVFSKWFARFCDKAGLSDPAIVFHSFRHNAEDAFRNANQQQYVIDRIIGHSDSATSAAYGEGIDLETAYAAVKAMKLKVRLPSLWNKGG